jgi:hypothetical protein
MKRAWPKIEKDSLKIEPYWNPVAAWDPSSRPEDAKKAVATFDHGELNGKIIRVNITG